MTRSSFTSARQLAQRVLLRYLARAGSGPGASEEPRPEDAVTADASAEASMAPGKAPYSRMFRGVCRDTRKAWYSTNMLSQCNPERITRARETLATGGASDIAALLVEMSGPAAPADPRATFGEVAQKHVQTAEIVARLLAAQQIQSQAPTRGRGEMLDIDALREAMFTWIDTGLVTSTADPIPESGAGQAAAQLKQIAVLIAGGNRLDFGPAGRMREALLASFAASVEALGVMRRLSPEFIRVLEASYQKSGRSKQKLDAWMRAYRAAGPDRTEDSDETAAEGGGGDAAPQAVDRN